MAASTHWLATGSAQAVLERGGNAFDAAVAAAFVLQVVEPHLNGPGGDVVGLFVTSHSPREPIVLMGQGPAPAAATVDHYRSEGLELVPGTGALAAAIPGAVDAWLLLLRDHGSWELADVLAFAVGYARDGHPLLPSVAATVSRVAPLFREHWPTSAEQWLPDGAVPEGGSLATNPALAHTFERLIESATGDSREDRIEAARHEWREGFVAQAIVAFIQTPHRHSTGDDHAGVITLDDLAGFEASYEQPVSVEFRGRTVAKAGAWSQGPVVLQSLAILDGFDDERLDPATGIGAHTILEAEKLAFADRESYYGDDVDVPLDHLLSADYSAERRALITDAASPDLRPGMVPGVEAYHPPLRVAADLPADLTGGGEPTAQSGDVTVVDGVTVVAEATSEESMSEEAMPEEAPRTEADLDDEGADEGVQENYERNAIPVEENLADDELADDRETERDYDESEALPDDDLADDDLPDSGLPTDADGQTRGDTCHLDIIDRWGNVVSATPSGGWLQSNPTIPELGFCLGTRLQMTWLDEGTPTTLTPGKRPRTTLSPTLLFGPDDAVTALGTPGGDQQDQWQLLYLLRTIVGGYSPQQAIDAPSIHSTAFPESFWPRTWTPAGAVVESRLGGPAIAELIVRGHEVTVDGEWRNGRVSAVGRDAAGLLFAAANARGMQGYAAGR